MSPKMNSGCAEWSAAQQAAGTAAAEMKVPAAADSALVSFPEERGEHEVENIEEQRGERDGDSGTVVGCALQALCVYPSFAQTGVDFAASTLRRQHSFPCATSRIHEQLVIVISTPGKERFV